MENGHLIIELGRCHLDEEFCGHAYARVNYRGQLYFPGGNKCAFRSLEEFIMTGFGYHFGI